MERKLLQARQLIPPLADQHLIKKIAKHYGKEIQIAIITRGIRDVTQFETLLQEFHNINSHNNNSYNFRKDTHTQPHVSIKSEQPRQGWRYDKGQETSHPPSKYHKSSNLHNSTQAKQFHQPSVSALSTDGNTPHTKNDGPTTSQQHN